MRRNRKSLGTLREMDKILASYPSHLENHREKLFAFVSEGSGTKQTYILTASELVLCLRDIMCPTKLTSHELGELLQEDLVAFERKNRALTTIEISSGRGPSLQDNVERLARERRVGLCP